MIAELKNKKPLLMEDLTWKDVEGYLKKRNEILIPFGSVEEHGYHLPLFTDSLIAFAICKELSRRTGILVAPVISYGICNTTRAYKGTATPNFDSFKAYVKDILSSFAGQGFKRFFLVSGHLGSSHVSAIKEACREAGADKNSKFLDMREISIDKIISSAPFHACEAETSLMLYLHEDKVDMKKAVDEKIVKKKFSLQSVKPTKSGVFGVPSKATKGKGKKIFEKSLREFEKSLIEH